MAFSWSSKKESSGAAPPADSSQSPEGAAGHESSEFGQLTAHLEKLREQFDQANERIAAYLMRRESRSGPATVTSGEASGLRERLDALAEMVQRLTVASPSATVVPQSGAPGVAQELGGRLIEELKGAVGASIDRSLQDAVGELHNSLKDFAADASRQRAAAESEIRQLREQLSQGFERIAESLPSPPPESEGETPVSNADWERAILGAALAVDPSLAIQRQQLVGAVLEGNAGACALAGQLLVFHSSPAERLPQLLKDVGEAYYRWQPKTKPGNTPMEESLVRWLQQNCETAGLSNTIELVHPGERFDSTRHAANSRGVEIKEVLGWIVLRDNGKVYTKASVAVR